MALEAKVIRLHFEIVAGDRRLSLALVSRRLHVATHALVGDRQRMRSRSVMRQSGIQLSDRAQQHVVLQRAMRRSAGNRPRGATMIVALGTDIDLRIVLLLSLIHI